MKEKVSSQRLLKGVVVSDKMDKTIVVQVERVWRHPLYGKVLRTTKNFKVHDENESAKIGDFVVMKECAPISKDKHMTLVSIENSTGKQG